MRHILLSTSILTLLSPMVLADEPLTGRVETNIRAGNERSIYMTEFWVPLVQGDDAVLYSNLRMMGDNQENREGNLGLGYREIVNAPLIGEGIIGVNAWIDRRITQRGSTFHQIATGVEWLGNNFDVRVNGYIPLSDSREIDVPNQNPQGPALSGTGIVVDTSGKVLEEPQHGVDLEVGFELGQHIDFIKNNTDSFNIYGGGYYFDGDNTENVAGWRTRFTADITPTVQVGARFQRDDERGSQGFLEATFRFPFSSKKSFREHGLRARLDESPERDIDIVTGAKVTDTGDRVAVINKETGAAQEVLHVNNQATGGGDGSAEKPFNTLAAAETAASEQTIIYVNRGDGTSANQNQGITLDKNGQKLIGSGIDFIYDSGKFTTANGKSPTAIIIAPATSAPVIGNVNAGQDGVTVSADNVTITGITVDNNNTGRDGIVVTANGAAASAQNVTIQNVTAQNNRMGVYIHGTDSGAVSAKVERTIATSNNQHGIAVYDDTDDTFEADLGGGSMGSTGNNVLAGNTLEDLAVEYDGRELAVMNNWWGQATGADTDTPDIGIRPQIYYGAPINDGLELHLTFDDEWTTNATAYDRSGQGNNGTIVNSVQSSGQSRGALEFDDDPADRSYVETATEVGDTDSKTFAGWFYADSSSLNARWYNLAGDGTSFDSKRYTGLFTSGANRAALYQSINGGSASFSIRDVSPITFDQWNFVAGTIDKPSGIMSLYVNNSQVATTVNAAITASTFNNPSGGVEINRGSPSTSFGWKGKSDNVQVYNRALTAPEISELYRMNTSSSVNTSSFLTSSP